MQLETLVVLSQAMSYTESAGCIRRHVDVKLCYINTGASACMTMAAARMSNAMLHKGIRVFSASANRPISPIKFRQFHGNLCKVVC